MNPGHLCYLKVQFRCLQKLLFHVQEYLGMEPKKSYSYANLGFFTHEVENLAGIIEN